MGDRAEIPPLLPAPQEAVDAIVRWVEDGHEGPLPAKLLHAFDHWLDTWEEDDERFHQAQGALLEFAALPQEDALERDEICQFLSDSVSDARLDAILGGGELTRGELEALVERWVRHDFEGDYQGNLLGWSLSQVQGTSGNKVILLIYWTGEEFVRGSLQAAFATEEGAWVHLQEDGILDDEWFEDREGALERIYQRYFGEAQ